MVQWKQGSRTNARLTWIFRSLNSKRVKHTTIETFAMIDRIRLRSWCNVGASWFAPLISWNTLRADIQQRRRYPIIRAPRLLKERPGWNVVLTVEWRNWGKDFLLIYGRAYPRHQGYQGTGYVLNSIHPVEKCGRNPQVSVVEELHSSLTRYGLVARVMPIWKDTG